MNKPIVSIPMVLVLYAMVICIPSSVYAKRTVRDHLKLQASVALQRIKSASATGVRARWHQDRGTVRSLYNLTLPLSPGTLETAARQCLSEHCDLFGMTDPHTELRLKTIQTRNRQACSIPSILQGGSSLRCVNLGAYQPFGSDTSDPQQLFPTDRHQHIGIGFSGLRDKHCDCQCGCLQLA